MLLKILMSNQRIKTNKYNKESSATIINRMALNKAKEIVDENEKLQSQLNKAYLTAKSKIDEDNTKVKYMLAAHQIISKIKFDTKLVDKILKQNSIKPERFFKTFGVDIDEEDEGDEDEIGEDVEREDEEDEDNEEEFDDTTLKNKVVREFLRDINSEEEISDESDEDKLNKAFQKEIDDEYKKISENINKQKTFEELNEEDYEEITEYNHTPVMKFMSEEEARLFLKKNYGRCITYFGTPWNVTGWDYTELYIFENNRNIFDMNNIVIYRKGNAEDSDKVLINKYINRRNRLIDQENQNVIGRTMKFKYPRKSKSNNSFVAYSNKNTSDIGCRSSNCNKSSYHVTTSTIGDTTFQTRSIA